MKLAYELETNQETKSSIADSLEEIIKNISNENSWYNEFKFNKAS
jgi:hypothetical protein